MPFAGQFLSGYQNYPSPREQSSFLPISGLPVSSKRSQRHGFFRRIGSFQLCILSLGTITIIGTTTFIGFVWGSDYDNNVWRNIILADWATRTVTVVSLIIRTIITAQAALCTSMLAALALQSFTVPIAHSAAVSLMRFENTGPLSLALVSLRWLRRRRGVGIGLITIALVFSTTVLQFISTILLSDVKLSTVVGFANQTELPYGYNYSRDSGDDAYLVSAFWDAKPETYATFAEYSESAHSLNGSHDTGMSMRAFFPVSPASQRESLKSYAGMATIIDTRVVCVSPLLQDIQVLMPKGEYPVAPYISGLISTDLPVSRFTSASPNSTLDAFNCSSAIAGPMSGDEWPLAVCLLNTVDGIVSIMDTNVSNMSWYMSDGPGASYLVSNITGSYSVWERFAKFDWDYGSQNESGSINGSRLVFGDSETWGSDSEWLTIPSNDPTINISLSLCYSAFQLDDFPIQASFPNPHTEPVIGWDTDAQKFDTEAIRQQLGATREPSSLESRGIFSLNPLHSWSAPLIKDGPTMPNIVTESANTEWDGMPNYIMLMCQKCTPGANSSNWEWIHQAQCAVFGDIVQETGHPALALQAQFTTLFALAYFDHAVPFDYTAPATTVYFVQALMPTSRTGFVAVCCLLALHLSIVGLTALLFRSKAPDSFIGDAWVAVAQLMGEGMEYWNGRVGPATGRGRRGKRRSIRAAERWVGLARVGDEVGIRSRSADGQLPLIDANQEPS